MTGSAAAPAGTTPLAGKTALVTGAAAGIGKAIAGTLAAEGASVVINHNHMPDLADGGRIITISSSTTALMLPGYAVYDATKGAARRDRRRGGVPGQRRRALGDRAKHPGQRRHRVGATRPAHCCRYDSDRVHEQHRRLPDALLPAARPRGQK